MPRALSSLPYTLASISGVRTSRWVSSRSYSAFSASAVRPEPPT
ncbi:Uncharacterised protein [Bordetella pertussis]|nr:Uncharacterised protein [Bordetella pertussis]